MASRHSGLARVGFPLPPVLLAAVLLTACGARGRTDCGGRRGRQEFPAQDGRQHH